MQSLRRFHRITPFFFLLNFFYSLVCIKSTSMLQSLKSQNSRDNLTLCFIQIGKKDQEQQKSCGNIIILAQIMWKFCISKMCDEYFANFSFSNNGSKDCWCPKYSNQIQKDLIPLAAQVLKSFDIYLIYLLNHILISSALFKLFSFKSTILLNF